MSNARDVAKSLIEHHLKNGFMTKNDIVDDLFVNHNIDRETTEMVWKSLEMENSAILSEYLLKVAEQELLCEQYDSTLIPEGSESSSTKQVKLISELESLIHYDPTLIPTPNGSKSSSSAPPAPGPPVNFRQANQTMLENVQPLMQQGPINMGGHRVTTDMPQNSILDPNSSNAGMDGSQVLGQHVSLSGFSGLMHPRVPSLKLRDPFPETSGALLARRPSVNWQELCSLVDQNASRRRGSRDVLRSNISSNLTTMPSQNYLGSAGPITNPPGLLGAVPRRFSSPYIRADVTASHGNRRNLKKDPQKIPKPTRKPLPDPKPLLSGQAQPQPQPIIRYELPTTPIIVDVKDFRDIVQKLTGWDGSTTPTNNTTRPTDANLQQQGPPVNFRQANQTMSDNVGASIVQSQIPQGPSISNEGVDISTTLRTEANAQNREQQQQEEKRLKGKYTMYQKKRKKIQFKIYQKNRKKRCNSRSSGGDNAGE